VGGAVVGEVEVWVLDRVIGWGGDRDVRRWMGGGGAPGGWGVGRRCWGRGVLCGAWSGKGRGRERVDGEGFGVWSGMDWSS